MNNNAIVLAIVSIFLFACGQEADPKQAFKEGKYELAYQLFSPLAENGDLDAQNYLGIQYSLGLGVRKDDIKAVEWFKKAAIVGHADAQRNLGDMVINGRGMSQDFYQAYIWYFAASQQGSESAKARLDALAGGNKLSPNQQMHAKIEANNYISDPDLRFISHDTYVK